MDASCQDLESNNDTVNTTSASLSPCDQVSCVPSSWRCDRVIDCPNGADEVYCNRSNVQRGMDVDLGMGLGMGLDMGLITEGKSTQLKDFVS